MRGEGGHPTRGLAIASYNVHRCIGRDGRHDPARIATVLRELDADVIGLQEVHSRGGAADDVDQLAYLAEATGFHAVSGPTVPTARGHCANALLTRHAVRAVRHIDLSVARTERRSALDVDLECDGVALRVVVTHLGLLGRYRRAQVAVLMRLIRTDDGPVVLLGDMNEWLPVGAPLRRLHGHFGRGPAVPSFPSGAPLLALDRIWMTPSAGLREFGAHRSTLARVASDHLPVRAVAELGVPTQRRASLRTGLRPATARALSRPLRWAAARVRRQRAVVQR